MKKFILLANVLILSNLALADVAIYSIERTAPVGVTEQKKILSNGEAVTLKTTRTKDSCKAEVLVSKEKFENARRVFSDLADGKISKEDAKADLETYQLYMEASKSGCSN